MTLRIASDFDYFFGAVLRLVNWIKKALFYKKGAQTTDKPRYFGGVCFFVDVFPEF